MKRMLLALLMILVATTSAEAAAKKKKVRKAKPAPAVEATAPSPLIRAANIAPEKKQAGPGEGVAKPAPRPSPAPVESQLKRAASRKFDLRSLPQTKPIERERPELPEPPLSPITLQSPATGQSTVTAESSRPFVPGPLAPAPPPNAVYEGLDRFNWGAGSPPDTNGDAGPTYYIQTVNTSVGVYRKADGFQEAAFTFNTLMSQGAFGNQCDTNNFGDPVVLYDTFEDRWIITDFAFTLDGGSNVNPPIAYQCFAVSMNGNPLTGGWNFYSIAVTDGLNDYPKFGIWNDGLYMSANVFGYPAGAAFKNARAWAFNKAQMYAGSPTVKVVSFDIGGGDFTVIPSNARLQTGTPPAGRPNLFVSTWLFTNALSVYKFHVDWNSLSLSTLTGPDTPIAPTSWPNAAVANAPQPGTATLLDVLQIRAMVQNQYTNFGGTESLWLPHTVRRANTSGFAAPRWYQLNVTGGTVAAATVQATTWDPDGANTNHRFMPSLAVDRAGDMALGYSISNSTALFPSLRYAGRLAADPANTFSLTEQTFFTGTASQTGTTRWGDYSSMTLDPDGCTFWYTSEYANPADQTFNHRWLTKFGSFGPFPGCTPAGAGGTVSGTVTVNPGGAPIAGATVNLGARSATTDGAGVYSFLNIPAGVYPSISASKPGFVPGSASNIVVTDGGTTTQNFALTAAPPSACLTDTTQADFLTGVPTNVDLNASPGDVTLSNAPSVDQQNTAGTTTGTGFGTPAWTGQTFVAGVTGSIVKADVQLFCNGCGATPPNLTLSVRNTSAGLPAGADLTTATIPGSAFASGSTVLFTATFVTPIALTSGTQYALILRPVSAPAGSGYFWIRASPSTYANGSRVLSADSGGTWSTDTTRDYNFKTYVQTGYSSPGNFVSSPKDANPAGGITPIWSTLSWNATTPANTSVKFQVAGSNNSGGPFTFVGPDGTAGTFFTTSPADLSQFYNLRYIEYKAILATTDPAQTPVLSDVTACFNDVDCSGTPPIAPTPAQVCGGSTGNTATGPAGATSYSWSITNGIIVGNSTSQSVTYTAGASGNVGLLLNVVQPNGCRQSSSINVPINPTPPQPSITPGGPTTFCAGGSVTLTSSAASGNQWYLDGNPIVGEIGTSTIATQPGSYTVIVTLVGCSSPPSAATPVTVNPNPPTPSINNSGPTTFCQGGSVTLTSDAPSGNQWKLNGNPIAGEMNTTYIATASGSYTVTVTDGNNCSATSAATVVQVDTMPPTPTISGDTNGTGTQDQACPEQPLTLHANGATGATSYTWYSDNAVIPSETASTLVMTGVGNISVTATNGTCTTPHSATYVVQNPTPHSPFISFRSQPSTTTSFAICQGASQIIDSDSATGIQWYKDGVAIPGANSQSYTATQAGIYTAQLNALGCHSQFGRNVTLTVNPLPPTPTITPGGPTTFCTGGSVTLTSSAASGNQWKLNGSPIGGATGTSYNATAAGSYTVTVTDGNACSATSAATNVTVNPLPPTPTINAGGPTTFCAGGSVTLTSSSASGNQWKLNGSPIGGATGTSYNATASGSYTVTVTDGNGCSATSAATTVTVNPLPNATITAANVVTTGSTGNLASVANAGAGATYSWSITNGTITAGTGTNSVTFTAGSIGTLTLQVTVTLNGCSDTKSKNVAVVSAVTVTSVVPANGSVNGGQPVTINGTGFQSGAAVTFGGSAATNVVVVSSTKITAKTPAHAGGAVNVTVTNTDTGSGTLTNGYTYHPQNFDPNNDGVIDPADVFYLVNYLFLAGPAPHGAAGMLSGDANGDGVVDPADIFYLVHFVFDGGPPPQSVPPQPRLSTSSEPAPIAGSISIGEPSRRINGTTYFPVIVSIPLGGEVPRAVSLNIRGAASIGRAGAALQVKPVFETSQRTAAGVAYLVSFPADLTFVDGSAVIAEVAVRGEAKLELDPKLTMLSDAAGLRSATVANGKLQLLGAGVAAPVRTPRNE